jgi:hypothetical protein
MSFYTSLDWVIKLRLFSYVLNLKIDVVLKALRAILISRCSLNEAPLGLFSFSFYLRIDRNFCSVHEEITPIRLYTPCNPRSGLGKRKGVDNMIEIAINP